MNKWSEEFERQYPTIRELIDAVKFSKSEITGMIEMECNKRAREFNTQFDKINTRLIEVEKKL